MVTGDTVAITAQKNFSGITSAAIVVKDNGQTAKVIVPVTVLPDPVTLPASTPKSLEESVISWKRSPNAQSYSVAVKGEVMCQTTQTSCSVPLAIGPKTPVQITALGGDNLTSVVPSNYQPNKPVPAITLNFKTGSALLSSAQKAELTSIAKVIKSEGFIRIVVSGHTDSQLGMDNQKLSEARAKSTADYLAKLVPGVDFVVRGYAASQPVAVESSAAGMAANRRAELSLW